MQGTDQTSSAQAAFMKARVGMCADVVERVYAVLGAADDDVTAAGHAGVHASLRNVAERKRDGNLRGHEHIPSTSIKEHKKIVESFVAAVVSSR